MGKLGFKCGSVPPGFNYGNFQYIDRRLKKDVVVPRCVERLESRAGTSWPCQDMSLTRDGLAPMLGVEMQGGGVVFLGGQLPSGVLPASPTHYRLPWRGQNTLLLTSLGLLSTIGSSGPWLHPTHLLVSLGLGQGGLSLPTELFGVLTVVGEVV